MDIRFLALFLLFVIGCGSGVAQVPIAVAAGKDVTETVAPSPDPTVKPLVGNPIAPVQDLEVGDDPDPDLNSHTENQ